MLTPCWGGMGKRVNKKAREGVITKLGKEKREGTRAMEESKEERRLKEVEKEKINM